MGNFEKLSVLVIVVIIVMILVVAVYTWGDSSDEGAGTDGGDSTSTAMARTENRSPDDDGYGDPDNPWETVDPVGPATEPGGATQPGDARDPTAGGSSTDVDPVAPPLPGGTGTMGPGTVAPVPGVDPDPVAGGSGETLVGTDEEWVYTVKSGDVLGKIAQRELGTVRRMSEIIALNPGLDADRIGLGDKITMPARGTVSAERGATATGPMTSSTHGVATGGASPRPGTTYTTRGHESLDRIAKAAYGNIERWPEIFALNKDRVRNPRDVPPGTELVLPR